MRSSIDVCNHLQPTGVKFELVTLSGPVKNAASLAEVLGLKPHEVVKTLLFMADGEPVMAMVPGDKKADNSKLKKHLGAEKVVFATESEARETTEYMIVALPPVGLKDRIKTVVDKRIKTGATVYAAGGSPNVVLKIRAVDLKKVTGATVADICG